MWECFLLSMNDACTSMCVHEECLVPPIFIHVYIQEMVDGQHNTTERLSNLANAVIFQLPKVGFDPETLLPTN